MTIKKQILSVRDFIEEYPISRSLFYEQVKIGKIKIIKVERRTFVARQDAELWLESLRNPQVL